MIELHQKELEEFLKQRLTRFEDIIDDKGVNEVKKVNLEPDPSHKLLEEKLLLAQLPNGINRCGWRWW